MLIPDRLPSLILLVGSWVPAAAAGWVAAGVANRKAGPPGAQVYVLLATAVVVSSAAWFLFQLDKIPPYVPGATMDPTFAPPEAVRGLAIVAGAAVLPVSAIACAIAFRMRGRALQALGRRA